MNPHQEDFLKLMQLIRTRPTMFLFRPSLELLATHLWAYASGKGVDYFNSIILVAYDFTNVLTKKYKMPPRPHNPTAWVNIIAFLSNMEEAGFDKFWEEWDEFYVNKQ